MPGLAGVPADGPDPAVTVHCGAYDCPHVTLPNGFARRPAAGQRGLLPAGQQQHHCHAGRQREGKGAGQHDTVFSTTR